MTISPKVSRYLKAALVEMKKESTEVLGRDPEAEMSPKEVRDDIKALFVTHYLIQVRLTLLEAKLKRLEFSEFADSKTGGHSIQ